MKQFKFITVISFVFALIIGCETEKIDSDQLNESSFTKEDSHATISLLELLELNIDIKKYEESFPLASANNTIQTTSSNEIIQFTTSSEDFDCYGIPVEDFEEPTQVGTIPNPLNVETDNHIFNLGYILPGISISNTDNGEASLVFLDESYPGNNAGKAIFTNYVGNPLTITFTDSNVTDVSLDVIAYADLNPETEIDIFSNSSLIGSINLTSTSYGVFIGIKSEEDITSITLNIPTGYVGIDNVSFGTCWLDGDGDGCYDDDDPVLSSNIEPTVIIDGCNTFVENRSSYLCGITMSDIMDSLELTNYKNHGKFVRAVAELTNSWLEEGLITETEKDAIMSCAGSANIP